MCRGHALGLQARALNIAQSRPSAFHQYIIVLFQIAVAGIVLDTYHLNVQKLAPSHVWTQYIHAEPAASSRSHVVKDKASQRRQDDFLSLQREKRADREKLADIERKMRNLYSTDTNQCKLQNLQIPHNSLVALIWCACIPAALLLFCLPEPTTDAYAR